MNSEWRNRPDDPKSPLGWMRKDAELDRLWLDELMTVPSPGRSFMCTAEVLRSGVLTGRDRGVATFFEEWIHFEGQRSSFSIARQDVRKRQGETITLQSDVKVRFNLPRFRAKGRAINLGGQFIDHLERWMQMPQSAEGESRLPPREVHPLAIAHGWRRVLRKSGLLFLTITIPLGILAIFHSWVFFFFGLSPLYGFLTAIRDLQNTRKLARIDQAALPGNSTSSEFHP